ncbi:MULTISPECIES: hypothetical protein [Halobacteriovorax]|uniref:Roadblock/LAMTOR2 domain-containing protein n=1 Tax=Halobacteriovorax vibrionivorans TaxID=2152716 RepID=A0ABY0IJJ8_9BACT|nr:MULTISPECIES: hypothetical protein [Halobacteriovorax]AYF43105.1 hypothetical protein BALOs_0084 [Halobacteriovorax sp. BALOs_7]RZF23126.1 hypothetical protein DAY19_04995 [Halobacteriovorax vibrionivorans]TGD49242.1 hypothetical protein EP118_00085 [Halobacteriovorax sp. Y22]
MDNIEYVIQEFFKEYSGLDSLVNSGLVVCRQDGIPLYSFKSTQTEFDSDTAGALIAGVWQASSVLSQFIPDETEDDFRFNYATSSKGIYITKLSGPFEDIYLSLIYFDVDNPAKLKSRVRLIETKLAEFIEAHLSDDLNPNDVFLFDDISDNEVDDLFSGVMG